eukprot:1315819-Pyramimonas_sp.AAC.1
MNSLLTIGGRHFARPPGYRPGYRTLAETTKPVLDYQRALRLRLAAFPTDGDDDSLPTQVYAELMAVRQCWKQWRADAVDELNGARRQGRRAEVARISRLLARTGAGLRERVYRSAPVALPAGGELAERWALPAEQGGIAAAVNDWVAEADRYTYDDITGHEAQQFLAPWTEEGLVWATHRLQELRRWIC